MFVLLRPTDETASSYGEVSRHDHLEAAQAAAAAGDRIEWQDGDGCCEVVYEA